MAPANKSAHDALLMVRRTTPARRAAAALVAVAAAGLLIWQPADAQDPLPGPPDDNYVYGQVLVEGANVSPPEQTLIAFVNGIACGWDTTGIAESHPDNPPADVGKTVYAVAVRGDGAGPAQKPGCGKNGDTIRFYLPELRRLATQTATFTTGTPATTNKRVDLSMAQLLSHVATIPLIAGDGTD